MSLIIKPVYKSFQLTLHIFPIKLRYPHFNILKDTCILSAFRCLIVDTVHNVISDMAFLSQGNLFY